ncbi:hypothetical protein CPC735_015050 [Coccidioides posadasii C735 delta SOWgp]|uniref:Alpha and gamma adaptin binding protein p34 n=1 Tax=Coccidioides posadasii (strain C735) TaxID=222929 RepID=C5PCU6_COCP7|nr:hypothetical protein CPC735_015050 [Coccidioides posadasii C735 delta SOWgp]EER24907.1 hypothetical protein CPC735_015050 [Coccidioides posadasii C735 delta SOWgp]|eukprot:XP_003067052.1 hypothetical protein CPC735_015050 [Coccidioides posadasii C735 delta SOWgp]
MSLTASGATAQTQKNANRISNPQRLLVLTPHAHSQTTIPPFLQSLTGNPVPPPGVQNDPPPNEETSQGPGHQSTAAFAGYTTHPPLPLNTKYYSADIPIWVDEIPIPAVSSPASLHSHTSQAEQENNTPSTWSATFLAPPAAEVRAAIGAILILLQKPVSVSSAVPSGEATVERERVREGIAALKTVVKAVADVKRKIEEERGDSGIGDVPGLVILVGSEDKRRSKQLGENFEDACLGGGGDGGLREMAEYGVRWWDEELTGMGIYDFEVVGWDPAGAETEGEKRRNEFGELEGMPRIREVLETNEWAMASSIGDDLDSASGFLEDLDDDRLDLEIGELEREMVGLRMAIENGGGDGADLEGEDFVEDDLKVEQMEGLMLRVQAIKDMGADLPDSERRKFAAKAIRDIMKDL